MHLVVEKGVPVEERKTITAAGLLDRDAARIFLDVLRCGSFRSAAERLNLSINAVGRRIHDFVRRTGATLSTRDVHGAQLTEEGGSMVAAVERMEAASFELSRASGSVGNALSGEIRVALTEGLGRFWSAPRLMFFASRKYLETHGSPRSLDEMHRHRLVLQVVDEAAAKEAIDSVFPDTAQRDLLVMKTNVSSANYWAVANGAGIGLFPTHALAFGGKIIPLDIELPWSFDIWLSYHASSGCIPRVRRMIDWLMEAFYPAKYPWRRIHPSTGT